MVQQLSERQLWLDQPSSPRMPVRDHASSASATSSLADTSMGEVVITRGKSKQNTEPVQATVSVSRWLDRPCPKRRRTRAR